MDWEAIKEQARLVYARGSQVLVFLQVIFYLVACVVASKPVGPKDYVRFAYHVIQWAPGRTSVTPAVYLKER
jgi:hypothetical protein